METTLKLETILNFGKHKGEQVEDLIEDQPKYIEWLYDKDVVRFDKETLMKIISLGII